jgi:hypothetical protein
VFITKWARRCTIVTAGKAKLAVTLRGLAVQLGRRPSALTSICVHLVQNTLLQVPGLLNFGFLSCGPFRLGVMPWCQQILSLFNKCAVSTRMNFLALVSSIYNGARVIAFLPYSWIRLSDKRKIFRNLIEKSWPDYLLHAPSGGGGKSLFTQRYVYFVK